MKWEKMGKCWKRRENEKIPKKKRRRCEEEEENVEMLSVKQRQKCRLQVKRG